jgi:hypothetical protein
MKNALGLLSAVGGAVLLAATPAAAHVTLQANLTAAQEVPAPDVTGHNPQGTATTLILENDLTIQYQITVQDLTGPAILAHIHEAPPGTPGPVVITLDHTTLQGTTPALTDAQLRALFAGDLYLNVHTGQNPEGEIRGQIVPPAPTCDCDTLSRSAFKKCVKAAFKSLDDPAERKTDAAKALKRAIKKASCGRTRGPKKAIACCLPVNPVENIVTDTLCAVVPERGCTNLGGTSRGAGSSCFTGSPCSPSGAFLDDSSL